MYVFFHGFRQIKLKIIQKVQYEVQKISLAFIISLVGFLFIIIDRGGLAF